MSSSREELTFAAWSTAYFSCELRKWLISYSALVVSQTAEHVYGARAVISVDVDVSRVDFDQCDVSSGHGEAGEAVALLGTHKCHRDTSQVRQCAMCSRNRVVQGHAIRAMTKCVAEEEEEEEEGRRKLMAYANILPHAPHFVAFRIF